MLVAVDTNVLVYAFRRDVEQHEVARATLNGVVARGDELVLLPAVAVEFLRVVTHPGLGRVPADTDTALEFLQRLLDHPAALWAQGRVRWDTLCELVGPDVRGNAVPDTAIAAAALDNGADAVLTNDRSFPTDTGLTVIPLDE